MAVKPLPKLSELPEPPDRLIGDQERFDVLTFNSLKAQKKMVNDDLNKTFIPALNQFAVDVNASVDAAAQSERNAAASATTAGNKANEAASSATTAGTKAGEASKSAAAAKTSETNAAASKTAAAKSATDAQAAQRGAEAARDEAQDLANVGYASDAKAGLAKVDGKTTQADAGGMITAKDVAIGGDTGDLASKRGQIGEIPTVRIADFNTFLKSGVYRATWAGDNPGLNTPPGTGNGVVYVASWRNAAGEIIECRQIVYRLGTPNANDWNIFTREMMSGSTWSAWRWILTDVSLGDGFRFTSGKISIPEYDGATSSAVGVSGLVPPAAAGSQEKYLRGDGTWQTPPNTTYTAATAAPKAAGTAAVGTSAKYAREDHVHPVQTTVSGNAGTATKLATARNFRAHLDITDAVAFDGTQHCALGVTGTLPIANGGTGRTDGKVAALATARTIDGVSFNGSANITHYGTCSTASVTAAKVVDCTGFTLTTGAVIRVKFTNTNTADNPTLNVNSTGAKAIRSRDGAIFGYQFVANCVYEFVYDGTYYRVVGDVFATGVKGAALQRVMIGNADAPFDAYDDPLGDNFAHIAIEDSPYIRITLAKPNDGSVYGVYQFNYNEFFGRIYGVSNVSPSLGDATFRWDSIYLKSSPSVSSDRTTKNTIEPLSDCVQLISGLKPVSFKYNDGSSDRSHYGLIAQDVEELLETLGIDFGGFIKSPIYKKEQETFTDENGKSRTREVETSEIERYDYSLRYEEFIAPMIEVIQRQQEDINSLKNELETLKQQVSLLLSSNNGGNA